MPSWRVVIPILFADGHERTKTRLSRPGPGHSVALLAARHHDEKDRAGWFHTLRRLHLAAPRLEFEFGVVSHPLRPLSPPSSRNTPTRSMKSNRGSSSKAALPPGDKAVAQKTTCACEHVSGTAGVSQR